VQTALNHKNGFRIGSLTLSRPSALLFHILTREQLFAGLCLLAFVNGTVIRIRIEADETGWLSAIGNTFGISVLVWAALWLSLRLLLQVPPNSVRPRDWSAAALVSILSLVPVAALSWLGLTGLAFYIVLTAPDGSSQRRGGFILLALTVPMFWSREFFAAFSDYILDIEAMLVATAMNSARIGNMVQLAGGSGYLQIWPACSSFGGVSLGVLCWVTFSQVAGYSGSRLQGMGWCLATCACVVVINVARISLIGFFPQHYDLLHGPIGAGVAGGLALLASVTASAIGVRARRCQAVVRREVHV
jgi:hypothetical protein